MSNQRFAEPEWQSSEQRHMNMDPREQQMYNPQPINVDPGEKIQPLPRRRRSRPWLWIIAVLVIAALLGTGANIGLRGFQNTVTEAHTYTVSTHPTLVINDDTGSITIHRGSANSQVTIQATKHMPQF